jgi:hypothetical protein
MPTQPELAASRASRVFFKHLTQYKEGGLDRDVNRTHHRQRDVSERAEEHTLEFQKHRPSQRIHFMRPLGI